MLSSHIIPHSSPLCSPQVCHGYIEVYRPARGLEKKEYSFRVDGWHAFGTEGHSLYTWHISAFGSKEAIALRIAACTDALQEGGEMVSSWQIAANLAANGLRPRWAELHLLFLTHVLSAKEYCNLHHLTHLDIKSEVCSNNVVNPKVAHLKASIEESRCVLAELYDTLPTMIAKDGVKARRELRLHRLTGQALGLSEDQLKERPLSACEFTSSPHFSPPLA